MGKPIQQPQPTSEVKFIRGPREKQTAPLTALKQASMNAEKSAISAQQNCDHTNETLVFKNTTNQGSGVMLEETARMDDYREHVPLEVNKDAYQATSLPEHDYNEELNAYAEKGFEGHVYDNPDKPFVEPSNIAMPAESLCQLRDVIGIEGSVVELSLDANMIKVELPGKLSVDWQLSSSGPPANRKDLGENEIEMLGNVHQFMNALYNPLFWKSAHVRSNYVNAPEFVPNQQTRVVAQNHQQGHQNQYGSQPVTYDSNRSLRPKPYYAQAPGQLSGQFSSQSLGQMTQQPSQPQQANAPAHSQQHFGQMTQHPSQPQQGTGQAHPQQSFGQMTQQQIPQVSAQSYPRQQHTQQFGQMPQVSASGYPQQFGQTPQVSAPGYPQQFGQMPQVSASGYPQQFGQMLQQGVPSSGMAYNPMMYRQSGAQPGVPASMPYQGSQMNGGNYAQHK